MEPSYADVQDIHTWSYASVYRAIAEGLNDTQVGIETTCSSKTVGKLRRFYVASEVEQVRKIVLKDGRIIPLTEKQARQISMIILASTRMDKQVLVKGHEPAFKLSDIVTDAEEILRLTQVEMSLNIMKPAPQKSFDMG